MLVGIPNFNRPKEKPQNIIAGRSREDICYSVRHWSENVLGAPAPVIAMPFAEGAGETCYNYGAVRKQPSPVGPAYQKWSGNHYSFGDTGYDENYISFGNESGLVPTSELTAFGVYYHTGLSSSPYAPVIRKNSVFAMDLLNRVTLRALIKTTGGTDAWTGANDQTITFDYNPHSVAIAWDGDGIDMYQDGSLKGVKPCSGAVVSNSSIVTVGGNDYSSCYNIKGPGGSGGLYNFLFWHYGLAQSQIEFLEEHPYGMYVPIKRPLYFFIGVYAEAPPEYDPRTSSFFLVM